MARAAAPVASSASTELLMAEKLDGDVPPPAKRHKFQESLRGAMAELDKKKEKEQQDNLPSVAPSSLIEEDWEAGMLVVPQNELTAGQGASIEEEWAVERIIEKRVLQGGEIKYCVKWVGFPDNTWEPSANFDPQLLHAFDAWEARKHKAVKEALATRAQAEMAQKQSAVACEASTAMSFVDV
eukprot:COSAG01_NODE_17160_length_1173_cov_2.300745_2_plen_183_part_01